MYNDVRREEKRREEKRREEKRREEVFWISVGVLTDVAIWD